MTQNNLLMERAKLYIKTIQSRYFLRVELPWQIRECLERRDDAQLRKILDLIRPLNVNFNPSIFSVLLETQDKKMLSLIHEIYEPYCLIPAQLYWACLDKKEEADIIEILKTEILSSSKLKTNLFMLLYDFLSYFNLVQVDAYLSANKPIQENPMPEEIQEICNYGQDYKQVFAYFETEEFQSEYTNFLQVNNLAVQACMYDKFELADKLYALLGYQDLHNMSIHDALDMEYSLVLQLVNDPYPEQYSRFYLDRPFPINNLDMTRRTPLDVCRATHHLELEQTLLDKGAKTSAQLRLELLAQVYKILDLI